MNNIKVLLTHAYFLEDDEKEKIIMKPYPPLGILSISGYLTNNHIENNVFDSTFSSFDKLKSYIIEYQPDVIGIYCNLMTKINVVKLMKFVRNESSLQHCKIVAGGPDVSYNIENYLNAGAHIVCIGEGEETFLELCQSFKSNQKIFEEIAGIAYFNNQKQIVKNTARIKIKNIDELPFPDRSKIDLQLYLDGWKKAHGENSISVSTQRGCPYTCKWCSTAVYGQSYRRRSPAKVVEEIKHLQSQYQFDRIWFVDDVFTVSHKWLSEFSEEVEKQKISVSYECISRADRLNEEVISILKKSGCFRIWIGAESGSQKIIDKMDRRVDVNHVGNMIIEAQKQGLQAGTFIMLGYPDETFEDIQLTANHLIRAQPEIFTVTLAYPIAGTDLFNETADIQSPFNDWENNTDRQREFKRTYPEKFYRFALRWMVNKVNADKFRKNKGIFSKDYLKSQIKVLLAAFLMTPYLIKLLKN